MNSKKLKIRNILKKYNYWRKTLNFSFRSKRRLDIGTNCQVACQSDPCRADPTCDFN